LPRGDNTVKKIFPEKIQKRDLYPILEKKIFQKKSKKRKYFPLSKKKFFGKFSGYYRSPR